MHTYSQKIGVIVIIVLCVGGLLFGSFNFVSGAESDEQVVASKLESIIEFLIILQRKLTQIKGQTDTNFINGNSLVIVSKEAQVYTAPGMDSSILGTQKEQIKGTVSGGPRYIQGHVWWEIDFDSGYDGWVKEMALTRIPSVVLEVDINQDGTPESRFRLVGEYEKGGFEVVPHEEGTAIRYKGEEIKKEDIYRVEY